MNITIHRGTQEIGGTCVQVVSGDHSILLDAGSPLGESRSHVELARLDFSDVFISHPHQDHYGLIKSLAADKVVHIGELARKLIDTTGVFLGDQTLNNSFCYLRNREWVTIGPDFRVLPYLMDHSCVDAFGFLIEAEGKRIYYSGDFRAHGRRKKAFNWFVSDPPQDVDLLLMEGTMMGRENCRFVDEEAVEQGMLAVLRKHDDQASFLVCSGQNIDRICAAYRACKKAGRHFVIDIYTAYILRAVSSHFPSVPDINTAEDIKVLTRGKAGRSHYRKVIANRDYFGDFINDLFRPETLIDFEEVVGNPARYLIKVGNFSDLLERVGPCSVIYSMWTGYLEQERYQVILNNPKVTFSEIHTSGHAIRADLQRFAEAIKSKRLVPVHTEHGAGYSDLFENVLLLKDGETLQI